MTTAQQERPTPEPSWDEHYRDERDAAFLYRQLAGAEGDPERRGLFERLAVVEDRHVSRWEELFHEGGRPLPRVQDRTPHEGTRVDRDAIWPWHRAAPDPGGGRARGAGLSRPRATLEQPSDAQGGGGHRGGFRRARARVVGNDGPRRRAVARRRVGRIPPQRRVRLQRRPDGELRTRGGRHRRGRGAAHRDHQWSGGRDCGRAIDGRQRLPGREE